MTVLSTEAAAKHLFDAWRAQSIQFFNSLKWEDLNKDEKESWRARAGNTFSKDYGPVFAPVWRYSKRKLVEVV